MNVLRRLLPMTRHWPLLAIGVGVGLLAGNVLDATAQTIIDRTDDEGGASFATGRPEPASVRTDLALAERRMRAAREAEAHLQRQLDRLDQRMREMQDLRGRMDLECIGSAAARAEEPEPVVAEVAEAPVVEAPAAPTGGEERSQRSRRERAARVAELSQTLQNMSRSASAGLVAELPHDLAVELLSQLSPRDAGRILDRVPAELAAELAEGLAEGSARGGRDVP